MATRTAITWTKGTTCTIQSQQQQHQINSFWDYCCSPNVFLVQSRWRDSVFCIIQKLRRNFQRRYRNWADEKKVGLLKKKYYMQSMKRIAITSRRENHTKFASRKQLTCYLKCTVKEIHREWFNMKINGRFWEAGIVNREHKIIKLKEFAPEILKCLVFIQGSTEGKSAEI